MKQPATLSMTQTPAEQTALRRPVRRPLVAAAGGLSAGIVFAYLFSMPALLLISAASMTIMFVFRRPPLILCLSALLAGIMLMSFVSHAYTTNPILQLDGKKQTLQGVIQHTQSRNGNAILKVHTSDGCRILLTAYDAAEDAFPAGARIRGSVTFAQPRPATNPGCFNYRLYLQGQGILMTAAAPAAALVTEGIARPLTWCLWRMRTGFQQKTAVILTKKQQGLLRGILFGDKGDIAEETYDAFQKNGTAHILAVSGLHVGILYSLLTIFLHGRRRIVPTLLLFLLLMLYAALAGFSPSVQRAVLMITLHSIAKLLHKRYDLLSAAGTAAILLLVHHPYALFNSGFQLSFLAVMIMAQLLPLFRNLSLPPLFRTVLLPTLVLQYGMGIYTIWCFNSFSFLAPLANIPVLLLAGMIVPCGILAMVLSVPFPFLAPPAAAFLSAALTVLEKINHWLYQDGRTAFDLCSPPLAAVMLFYLVFFLASSEMFRIWILRRQARPALLALLLCFILTFGTAPFSSSAMRGADIIALDVGQGACLFIRSPGGRTLLIDGGGRRSSSIARQVLRPVLLKNGIKRIDTAIATHKDMDHYKGLTELQELGMVRQLIDNENGLAAGDILLAEPDSSFSIRVLAPLPGTPHGGTTESNERSLVLQVCFDDISLLATGDIGKETEEAILASGQQIKSSLLAVPHHGSKNSSSAAFVAAVDPDLAVIQVGNNRYGHPAPETLSTYAAAGIPLVRTDRQGAVGIWRTRRGAAMKTML